MSITLQWSTDQDTQCAMPLVKIFSVLCVVVPKSSATVSDLSLTIVTIA